MRVFSAFLARTVGGQCLLGQLLRVHRQKALVKCWNGERYERRPPVSTPCACTPRDYQCDFGTVRDDRFMIESEEGTYAKCVKIAGMDVGKCPSIARGEYVFSK